MVTTSPCSISSKGDLYHTPPELDAESWDQMSDVSSGAISNRTMTESSAPNKHGSTAKNSMPSDTDLSSLEAKIANLSTMPAAPRMNGVQPGIYFIENERGNEMVLDLAGYDFATVLGYNKHGGDNQKWEIEPLGPGYSIKSMFNASYITLNTGALEGGSMVTSPFPVSWEIEGEGDGSGLWKIRWPRSDLVFDLPSIQQNQVLLTSAKSASTPNHHWRLQLVSASRQPLRNTVLSESTSSFSTKPQTTTSSGMVVAVGIDTSQLGAREDEEMEITTTTTTVTTSVSRMRRFAVSKAGESDC